MFPQQTSSFVIFCPYFWFWHIERSVFPRQFRFHSQTYLLTNLNNHVKSHHYLFACLKDSCQFAAKVLPGHLDQLENQKKITWCHYFQDCNSIKASDQFAKWTPLKTTTTKKTTTKHKADPRTLTKQSSQNHQTVLFARLQHALYQVTLDWSKGCIFITTQQLQLCYSLEIHLFENIFSRGLE